LTACPIPPDKNVMARPPQKPKKPANRQARLAEALRANLKRRKAQARVRSEPKTSSNETKSG
jgi:hypothetical protein